MTSTFSTATSNFAHTTTNSLANKEPESLTQPEQKSIPNALNQTTKTQENLSNWMPDVYLQNAVARALEISVSEITKEKMLKLKRIEIGHLEENLASLQGLEYATNLKKFEHYWDSKVSDYSCLEGLVQLEEVSLNGVNVTDENFPMMGPNIELLNLTAASVTDAVYDKITPLKSLKHIVFQLNPHITTIAPLGTLTELEQIYIPKCGVSDMTVIKQLPKLSTLPAGDQNIGTLAPAITITEKELNYDALKHEIFLPFSMMPQRLTNFDGYIPPFVMSNDPDQLSIEINSQQLPSTRLLVSHEGVTISGVSKEELASIEKINFRAKLDNPRSSYAKPDNYFIYSISRGTYSRSFQVEHQQKNGTVQVQYLDRNGHPLRASKYLEGEVGKRYDASTSEYKLALAGYRLDETQLPQNANGLFLVDKQIVRYIYKETPVNAQNVTVYYLDENRHEIAEKKTIEGLVGEPYDTSTDKYCLSIEGYELDTNSLPDNRKGMLGTQAQVVEYCYKKMKAPTNSVSSESKDDSFSEMMDKQVDHATTNSSGKKTTNSSRGKGQVLPKTGEKKKPSFQFFGVFLIGALGLDFIQKKRIQNDWE
ncbi:MucBP domain-containing protein [Vagococcus entomophilus]|uniref:MucBP domain-containing protein n=1 Tax=Vagococcus entomophilus TaxID=1160095 RepID=A0A430AKJ4_9ENTE|nr:MucBP domain-containing protein [Vagococcus entomophilus]RSU08606.1 hypothetical protein CBF30_05090 [Vagococcus entomophilus]